MWETRVQSLGQEDPLKKKMAKATVHGVTKSRTHLSGSHFSVYSCHLFLISSASVRSILFLSFIVPIFAWNVPFGISSFLKEFSSLTYSIVFLYFFAFFTLVGFLISPCYSVELYIQMDISFLFSFTFHFSSQLFCKVSDNHFAFLHFFFLGKVLISASYIILQISVHSSLGTLSIRSNPLNLFVTSTI